MRRLIIIVTTISGLVLAGIKLSAPHIDNKECIHPQPTDGIHIPDSMEDGSTRNLKKEWFEAIHSCSDSTDWRAVERATMLSKYESHINDVSQRNPGIINIGHGQIIGEWEEKGSNNLSGCMKRTAYDKKEDKLYALAGGGSLWKGGVDGLSWEVENQDIRFDGNFLDVVYPESDVSRLLVSIGGLPYYKDSDSEIWTKSEGIAAIYMPTNKNQLILGAEGQNVFFLSRLQDGGDVSLFYSEDFGGSFSVIKSFPTYDLMDVAIATDATATELYLIEETSHNRSNIYIFNKVNKSLTLLTFSAPLGFGTIGDANLQVLKENGITKLYAYNALNELKYSINNGLSWIRMTTLPIRPWDSGLFISPSDPQIMMIGAINAYRSQNGGYTWELVNQWSEYYSDMATNLHADIMYINEIETIRDGSILMVSTHGGIHRSFDNGNNFQNIGFEGLNASQYYSVKTSPYNKNYIFTGSQDQGIQRGRDFDEGVTDFVQFKAGDYGHLQFTNYGRSLWSIYPGGDMYYYPDPINSDESLAPFDLLVNNQSIWLPPIITSPYNPNAVLIAGGSLLNTTGSHIVDVSVDDLGQLFGTQWPFNFSMSGGEVSAMSYNLVDSDEFYVLTTNGKFYKSTNRGVHFEEKDTGLSDAHHLYGNTILCSKHNRNRIFIAGSGYDNPAVYYSEDGGESFTSIVEGLPNTTVFQMVYDEKENFVFAATEAGPYALDVKAELWYEIGQGAAPNQRYWSVEYLPTLNKVRYGTFGRGIWDLNIDELNSTTDHVSEDEQLTIHPNPTMDVATLRLPQTSDGRLKLISIQGKTLLNRLIDQENIISIDVSDYADGLYYIIFENGTDEPLSSIMIKL